MFYEHFKIEQIMVTDGHRIEMLISREKQKTFQKKNLTDRK